MVLIPCPPCPVSNTRASLHVDAQENTINLWEDTNPREKGIVDYEASLVYRFMIICENNGLTELFFSFILSYGLISLSSLFCFWRFVLAVLFILN